ncbi:MAG: DUF3887 domain-containing protein [Kaiparowitsia implicata GSE-PSE-MK54-09C]|jgi:hypothetical protein|nr:DUF3887 domain-containing protein [Kaiparowitsia implicata GSE-PSE-MK54-09C]
MNKLSISLILAPAAVASLTIPTFANEMAPPTETILVAQGSDFVSVAQNFVTRLGQQQFTSATQDYDAIAQDVTTQSLQQYWNDIVSASGSFQQIIDTQLLEEGEGDALVLVSCQFERDRRDLIVLLTNDGVTSFNVVE